MKGGWGNVRYGFRDNHNTTLQRVNVLDTITNKLNRRHKVEATLLDIEEAYDKISHDGLIFKLLALQVPHQLINIIWSFFKDRRFYIKIGDTTSSTRKIDAGVPQGSCLSPHLFSVYKKDIPKIEKANIALFADDTIFYATGEKNSLVTSRLQKQIDMVFPSFYQWKITNNPVKTKAILFSNNIKYREKIANIKFGNNNPMVYISQVSRSKLRHEIKFHEGHTRNDS